jgi:predicted small secreted protein
MKRSILTLLLLCFTSSFLIGCNTVEGVGKDVEKAGEEVQDASK